MQSVILRIILWGFLNGILRIGRCDPPDRLGGCRTLSVKRGLNGHGWDVRKPWHSNGEVDNMIVGQESGQAEVIP
jgi:hypothetical protein